MLSLKNRCLTQRTGSPARHAASGTYLVVLVLAPVLAWAQAHVKQEGSYVLRASTVSAEALPESMRSQHGIPPGPGKAVLNVTVQHRLDGAVRNVPARIEVTAHNPMGIPTGVDLRQVSANGMVSYLGVYDFLPREVLDFRIRAWPQGSDASIELSFTDQLGRR